MWQKGRNGHLSSDYQTLPVGFDTTLQSLNMLLAHHIIASSWQKLHLKNDIVQVCAEATVVYLWLHIKGIN